MTAKKWSSAGKYFCFGLLCVGFAGLTQASIINISTGSATYNITADTNGGTLDNDFTGTAFLVTSLPTGAYAHVSGLTDGTDSGAWVGPNANQLDETSAVTGSTTYTVTFNLTGYNYTTAQLIMSVAADDFISSITLNSTTIFTDPSHAAMWAAGTTVAGSGSPITGDFVAGLNTITFVVPNYTGDGASSCCGPTGLDVAADVLATPSGVPEPGTLGLTGLCLVGLVTLVRRRRVA